MAEGETKVDGANKGDKNTQSVLDEGAKEDVYECAVCLQTCIHPAQLPCGHIFCFLCIKGIANQSKRCAMCRQEIPRDFIEQPNLLTPTRSLETTESFDGGYQWFYEGRNGWWQYDERTSKELEASYKAGERTCELLIAGFLYVTDLEAMLQIRRNDPSRRRRIKRDLATISKKGIAGLRTEGDASHPTEHIEIHRSLGAAEGRTTGLTPLTPSNTPQTPTSGRQSPNNADDLQTTINRIQSLQITSENFEEPLLQHGNSHSQNRPNDNSGSSRSGSYNLRYRSAD